MTKLLKEGSLNHPKLCVLTFWAIIKVWKSHILSAHTQSAAKFEISLRSYNTKNVKDTTEKIPKINNESKNDQGKK